ncbi:MFS transporter [Novosphingobium endophyticum]|uniref:MFS transporter n=1 Tax=Novosphingobium endophyticum TaxID=1955250 RepID=A0A916TVW3_9SPHN|nr:MFS transporter [Novosphingobium endophyticum]GGC12992.1 MFS transporter [Novosphingobium endophyticum]
MTGATDSSVLDDDLITRLLDRAALTAYHWRIFLLCGLVAVMDGFDSVIIGITAPAIARDLDIEINSFGPIFAAAQVGFMAGAFLSGPAADRWGRKLVLGLSALVFALATLSTVAADSYQTLLLVRLVTGIGLGGAATNFVALCSDFAPARLRATILAVLWAMIPGGNVVGGLASAAMLPSHGWQLLYVIGGAVPAVAAGAILLFVPESPKFLVRNPARLVQAHVVLKRLRTNPPEALVPPVREEGASHSAPVAALFRGENARVTGWIWLCAFMCWLMLLTVLSWMAPLMQQLGLPIARASLAVASNSAGAIVGALVLGPLMDRYDRYLICASSILVGAVATAITGMVAVSFAALAGIAFVLGFTVGGASAGVMAIIATSYPTAIRATGLGWAIGIARIGSAVGPVAAGVLLQWGASAAEIFALLALPCAVAAFALLRLRAATQQRQAPAPQLG